MKKLLLLVIAGVAGLAVTHPSTASAHGLVVTTDFARGEGFQVSLGTPVLETRMDAEDDGPVNVTQERIKGSIKLGVGIGLLAAGGGLTAVSIYGFVLAGAAGSTTPTTGALGGIAAGALVALGIVAAAGAAACIIIGAILLPQGIAHMKRADAAARRVLEHPEQRYAVDSRARVRWGFRFGGAPTPARFW